MRIGVIGDTHGHLAMGALAALSGVDHILHTGDIGRLAIIEALEAIAPVTAVQGNVDERTPLAERFPIAQEYIWEGVRVYLTHVGGKPKQLVPFLPEPRPQVFVFGHSHRALLEHHAGVLFLNPGAAGRPRFGGGLSVALLDVRDGAAHARIVALP